jgi:hypothetical protein
MRVKYIIPILLLLLSSTLLSACSDIPGTTPSLQAITPDDTSAGTLKVTVGITEDQDATDGKSMLTLQFRTNVIEEANYVIFAHKETIICNGTTLKLGDTQMYNLNVARVGRYACSYTGYSKGIGQLAPLTVISALERSTLAPYNLMVSNKRGYTINYVPDASGYACPITTEAHDANNVISGPNSSSDLGVYRGPDTSSLTGSGTILLRRTCSWTLHGPSDTPFDTINLTYQSTANYAVTWGH